MAIADLLQQDLDFVGSPVGYDLVYYFQYRFGRIRPLKFVNLWVVGFERKELQVLWSYAIDVLEYDPPLLAEGGVN